MSTPTHAPGVFEIMAKWKKEEIVNYLNTVAISDARTLFESGARLEAQRDEMLAALKAVVTIPRKPDAWRKANDAIAKAERKPMVVHGAPINEE